MKTYIGHEEKGAGAEPSREPGARSAISARLTRWQRAVSPEEPRPLGLIRPWQGCAEASVNDVQLVLGGRGHGETLRWQGTHRDQPVPNRRCMQSQACVSLSKRMVFHGVILLKQSETGIRMSPGLPASLWEHSSLDGGGFPFEANCLLTKYVSSAGLDSLRPCSRAAEASLSGPSYLLR